MKLLFRAANLPDAHIVMHLLSQAGIPAHVLNENAQSAFGEVPAGAACPQVWITQPHQESQARAVIAKFESNAPPIGEVWKCGQCAEQNPATFELCWACGGS
jgi:hypothetical protein